MRNRILHGDLLRETRERQGIHRTELARRANVSLSWIKAIELEGKQPSDVKAHALAGALGVDIDTFCRPT